jgi:hypothetical protein
MDKNIFDNSIKMIGYDEETKTIRTRRQLLFRIHKKKQLENIKKFNPFCYNSIFE